MANRRMFTMDIVDSDAFLDMPLTTQALYFHLNMRADDDGFVNNPMKIQRVIGANKNDYDMLVAKRFILVFDKGVIVIKHWRMHNYIKNDRYKPTPYQDELKSLELKENKSYTESSCIQVGTTLEPECIHVGSVELGKDSIDKDIDKYIHQIWAEYPNKVDKAKALKKIEKHLEKYTYEQMIEAIQRYVSYVDKVRATGFELKYQGGLRFFDTGIIDYLGDDYVEPEIKSSKKSQFTSYQQRSDAETEETSNQLLSAWFEEAGI